MADNPVQAPLPTSEPADAYPAAVADTIAVLRDEPKDAPDEFIGREQETRTIMRAIHGSIPTKRRGQLKPADVSYQPAVLRMITGGPGAGKTSLLKAVEKRCRHHRCRVIRLQEKDLENPATLTKAVREKCHWRGRDTLNSLGRELANSTAAAADALASGWLRRLVRGIGGIRAEPGSDLEADRIRPARAVLECWQRDAPADPADVLRLLSRLGPTVITIDEAHQLDRYLGTDRTDTARTVIRTLATPESRHEAGVQKCIMVVAGLNDLHPTVTELGTFRQTPFQLGTFSEADVTAILEHWIKQARAPADPTERAMAEWLPALAHDFGQWPHHTVGAGMGARAILEADPNGATVHQWGLRAAREIAENHRSWLYGYITGMAQQDNTPLEAVLAVAYAMHNSNGIMTTRQVELLTGRVLETERQDRVQAEPTAPQRKKIPDTATAVRIMLRAGILEYADIDGTATLPSRLRVAVPSLGRYLRAIPLEPNGPAVKALAQCKPNSDTN